MGDGESQCGRVSECEKVSQCVSVRVKEWEGE